MIDTFELVSVFSDAFESDSRSHVYSGRSPFGALLVKWNGHKRVLIQAWDTTLPIGRKKLHAALQRSETFKGHKIDAWIFIGQELRKNTYRLVDEYEQ
jgi:hypothetical protein